MIYLFRTHFHHIKDNVEVLSSTLYLLLPFFPAFSLSLPSENIVHALLPEVETGRCRGRQVRFGNKILLQRRVVGHAVLEVVVVRGQNRLRQETLFDDGALRRQRGASQHLA